MFGHHKNTCKNPITESSSQGSAKDSRTPTFVNTTPSAPSHPHASGGQLRNEVNLNGMTLQSTLGDLYSKATIESFNSQSTMCSNSTSQPCVPIQFTGMSTHTNMSGMRVIKVEEVLKLASGVRCTSATG
ncbi:hypothetical protein QJS04_geneDACA016725 [Acorus gramineus]|uniref:Uncharacterized protein n=1 Tax=Acorus gramineus TaxID=55184 RepID=A0AAV9ASC1_ACOGR|nr:hypothetical protein QJS04_geneDACA016725 [Acorus gramineus]